MFCPNCGKRISVHTQYCPYCGTHVSANSAIANNEAMLHQSNNQGNTNNFQKHIHHKARKLLLAIFAVAIIGGGYWGYMNSTMTVNLNHSMPDNTYSTQVVNSSTDKPTKISDNSSSDMTFKSNNDLNLKGNDNSSFQNPHYRLHRHTLEIEGKVSDAPLNMKMYLNLNKIKHHDKDLYFKYNKISVTPSNSKARHMINVPKVRQSLNSMINKMNQKFRKELNGHHRLIRFRKK